MKIKILIYTSILLFVVQGTAAEDAFEVVPNARQMSTSNLAKGSVPAQMKQRAIAKHLPLEIKLKKSGIVFRLIPAGSFQMGSPEDELSEVTDKNLARNPKEKQISKTIEKPYYIGKFELSQQAWEAILRATPGSVKQRYNQHALVKYKYKPSTINGVGYPVEKVNFYEVKRWITFLEKYEGLEPGTLRLPTNTEWEFACRAGTKTMHYSGNTEADVEKIGWINKNSGMKLQPSGKKLPNAYGLYDMIGNVTEQMHYVPGEITQIAPEFLKYLKAIKKPEDVGTFIRGGTYEDYYGHCRAAVRHNMLKIMKMKGAGFRIAIPDAQKLIGKTVKTAPKPKVLKTEFRVFTSKKGTKLTARLLGVSKGKVKLLKKNGKEIVFSVNLLSKADIDYLKSLK